LGTTRRREGDKNEKHWELYVDGKPTGVFSDTFKGDDTVLVPSQKPVDRNTNNATVTESELPSHIEYVVNWSWRYGDEQDIFTSKKMVKEWWKDMCETYDEKELGMVIKSINKQRVTLLEYDVDTLISL
jgi:hypothetical protein